MQAVRESATGGKGTGPSSGQGQGTVCESFPGAACLCSVISCSPFRWSALYQTFSTNTWILPWECVKLPGNVMLSIPLSLPCHDFTHHEKRTACRFLPTAERRGRWLQPIPHLLPNAATVRLPTYLELKSSDIKRNKLDAHRLSDTPPSSGRPD